MADSPNLLFIFADQMRGMDMRCAGNAQVHTPNMDRMAAQGMRLTNAIATTPVCGPNRAVLLTATYPTTHTVLGNDLPLPVNLPTLGAVAQSHGYSTGYIGKWHLDGMPRDKFTPPGPRRFGWDFWAAYNCSHDYFHPRYFRDSPMVIEPGGYEPVVQTDLAIDFLKRHVGSSKPFCLALSWGPPHDPYDQVPTAYRDRYDPQKLPLRPNVQPGSSNPLAKGLECRRVTADYYAAITALDHELGRLLDTLDMLQLAQNTLVVFTSDHGDMLWSHGMMKKQTPYAESIDVPFLVRHPGRIPAGRVSDVLMATVDIAPTLAGWLGWTIPPQWEGRDVFSVSTQEDHASVFIANHCRYDEAVTQNLPEWRGVRTSRFTYAETVGRRPWLLFDNKSDPFQLRNLVDDASQIPVKQQLQRMLDEWLVKTNDPFLPTDLMMSHYGLTECWRKRELEMHPPGSGA
ncbi:MAG: sulfatase family protein [Phycisphaerae bacterium]